MSQELIKFSINHWSTEYFPAEEPFYTWMHYEYIDKYLLNTDFVKKNKLVVAWTEEDMSFSFAVTAPKEFIEQYCPCLLYNESNKKFIFKEEDEFGLLFIKFQKYSEENIGIWYWDKEEDKFYEWENKNDN